MLLLPPVSYGGAVSLKPEDIEKIAHLARLQIEAADIPGYARNLSEILALVEQMNSVDTQGVQPMAHPQDVHQRLRPDEVTEVDQRESFQRHAPLTETGLYLVPRVIE
jgi:aspartyl-tRNA(Asn)/glutamyl-tRNA(Gln) amidotransferase subunit C